MQLPDDDYTSGLADLDDGSRVATDLRSGHDGGGEACRWLTKSFSVSCNLLLCSLAVSV